MSTHTQTITRNSGPFAPKLLIAPSGWSFDQTAVEVWYWLLAYTRLNSFKRQRDRFVCEAKIEALANVLAGSLGMATPYWVLAARELSEIEV